MQRKWDKITSSFLVQNGSAWDEIIISLLLSFNKPSADHSHEKTDPIPA